MGDSTMSIVNMGFCIAMCMFYMWMAVTALYLSTRVRSVTNEAIEPGYVRYYEAWWWMKDGVKNNSFFARHHHAIMYSKDPILAALLVFGHDYPPVQIGSIAAFNLLFFILYVKFLPFDELLANMTEIVNYLIFALASGTFFLLALEQLELAEKTKYTYVAYTIMLLLIILLIF